VIVDDFLPVINGSRTVFSKLGPDSALWVPILEKAFAKYQGNYENIVGGDPRWAVRTLTGAPYDIEFHGSKGGLSTKALWDKIVAFNNSGDMVMTGTSGGNDT